MFSQKTIVLHGTLWEIPGNFAFIHNSKMVGCAVTLDMSFAQFRNRVYRTANKVTPLNSTYIVPSRTNVNKQLAVKWVVKYSQDSHFWLDLNKHIIVKLATNWKHLQWQSLNIFRQIRWKYSSKKYFIFTQDITTYVSLMEQPTWRWICFDFCVRFYPFILTKY